MKDVVDVLLPYMSGSNDRRALVESALFGCRVLNQIEWSGTAYTFTVGLVRTLLNFGECQPGRPAIVMLLEALKEQVGSNQQARIDTLLREYSRSISHGGKNMDPLGLTFLIKVGEWAMNDLKERWTLRRKEQALQLDTITEPELKQQEPAIVADLVSDRGQANVQRTIERIEAKRDLIEGWKDSLVTDQKQAQLGEMNRNVQQARARDFNEQVTKTLREIEADLRAIGFTLEKSN